MRISDWSSDVCSSDLCQVFNLGDQDTGSLDHQSTGFGQLDPPPMAHKQFCLKLVLEQGDMSSERRLGEVEIGCRASDVPISGELHEITPAPDVHGPSTPFFHVLAQPV